MVLEIILRRSSPATLLRIPWPYKLRSVFCKLASCHDLQPNRYPFELMTFCMVEIEEVVIALMFEKQEEGASSDEMPVWTPLDSTTPWPRLTIPAQPMVSIFHIRSSPLFHPFIIQLQVGSYVIWRGTTK